MNRTWLVLVSAILLGALGCQPAASPTREGDVPATPPATPLVEKPAPEPAPELDWPEYSEEQAAAAKSLAETSQVVLKEDAEGNVISMDTAANRSWVTAYDLQELLAFPRLKSLAVEGDCIDADIVQRIAAHPALDYLFMKETLIDDAGIEQLAGLKFLTVIDLWRSPLVTDKGLETLSNMPQLKAVRINGLNGVTDDGIAMLLKLPQLKELDIRTCGKVTGEGISRLADKRSLRMLKIGGKNIGDDVLEIVGKFKTLTGLSLDNCPITDAGVAKLAALPLTDFAIYQCANVTDGGVAFLAEKDQLAKLALRDVAVQGTILGKLPNPEKLVWLHLGQSRISDAEIGNLEALVNLETLVLSQSDITDASVDTLAKLTKLKRLIVTETGITAEGVEKLQAALPDCQIQFN